MMVPVDASTLPADRGTSKSRENVAFCISGRKTSAAPVVPITQT